uniref:Outer membrane protein assembly factor BamE n=1 Tax=Candidatus Kentrum sp. UNK TaxID=2126344 RepID=A0A451B030_9GAMM|nr:MAG: Beta-barrel assembly machine subunit BamE [Candidatus Kentron sp. UNK]VFK71626.1 MAG: Beta-barrel assembly machine subunit BamE [Candidatus Kentron sp. UNK]
MMRLSARSNFVKRWTGYWLLIAITAIPACSKVKLPDVEVPDVFPDIVYKVDVQQGNVVTQEMLDKLERGMDKRKVRFILGTPLVVSAFNKDRWDYVHMFQSGGGDWERSGISLFFKDDKLQYVDGSSAKITLENQPPPSEADSPTP